MPTKVGAGPGVPVDIPNKRHCVQVDKANVEPKATAPAMTDQAASARSDSNSVRMRSAVKAVETGPEDDDDPPPPLPDAVMLFS